MAVLSGCGPEVFRYLLLYRADRSLADKEGGTAMMYACRDGMPSVVIALGNHSAYMGFRDHRGMTPLMHAAANVQK